MKRPKERTPSFHREEVGDQDRGRHTTDLQELLGGLLIEKELGEGPDKAEDQEGEELTCAQVVIIFMGEDVEGGEEREQRKEQNLQPIDPVRSDDAERPDLQQGVERRGEGGEVVRIDTPTQDKPIDRA